MKFKLLRMAAAIHAAAILFSAHVSAEEISVSARSAILIDADSGRILWQKNSEERALIASTTKIMTGLIVAEECRLDSPVCIPDCAVGVEGSSVYLKSGEIMSVEELLYGMMLHSGNDAALALALHCGGNLENFVQKMNFKAEKLGLEHTSFANPHGLDSEENYATAHDLAVLAAAAMNNEVFRKVVSTKEYHSNRRSFVNHNKLLWLYDGAVGVKTGYTKAAGRILVSCAERNERRLIAVTISAPRDWNDHILMLDHGFLQYSEKLLVRKNELKLYVPVLGGSEEYAVASVRKDFIYPVLSHEQIRIVPCVPHFLYAPVLAGQNAGVLMIYLGEECIAQLPLYWQFSVLEGA